MRLPILLLVFSLCFSADPPKDSPADQGIPQSNLAPEKAHLSWEEDPYSGKKLVLHCSDGTKQERSAGEDHFWLDLKTNADGSVVFVQRAFGDSSGYEIIEVHRFEEKPDTASWSEAVVLQSSELTRWFPERTFLMRVDRVSKDGRTISIGINKPEPREGFRRHYSRVHLCFDTRTREFSAPFTSPPANGSIPDVSHPLVISSAKLMSERGSFLAKSFRLESVDGRVLDKPAGEDRVWMDLIKNADSTIAYAVLCRGDEQGANPEAVHRFHASSSSDGWNETVVLGRSELTKAFSEDARLGALDSVSPVGETLLVFVRYQDLRVKTRVTTRGNISVFDHGRRMHTFLFDTKTRKFSSPIDD